jgi:hypothetical protein
MRQKDFIFPDGLHDGLGDCYVEAGAEMILFEDGSTQFHAITWSDDTNDELIFEFHYWSRYDPNTKSCVDTNLGVSQPIDYKMFASHFKYDWTLKNPPLQHLHDVFDNIECCHMYVREP